MAFGLNNQDVHDELVSRQTGEFDFQDEPQGPVKINRVGRNVNEVAEYESINPPEVGATRLFDPSMSTRSSSVSTEAREAGFGDSTYDTGVYIPGEDLEDRRARSQSNGWKIANGAIKGVVTAGTTAVNTVAGTIDGLLEGGYELGREIATGEDISGGKVLDAGVNNFVARTMLGIQNYSEELFPNYRTEEEQSDKYQDEWYKHIFTANFIGDSFLKNFGFTVGAMAGGSVWTKALSASMIKKLPNDLMKGVVASSAGDSEAAGKLLETLNTINRRAAATIDADILAKNITEAAKAINKMQAKLQLSGSVIAAMGEGLVEGNMARNEFLDDFNAKIAQQYIGLNDGLEDEVLNEDGVYRRQYRYIDEDTGEDKIGYELNGRGMQRLDERRQELANNYADIMQFATQQADRLASTTFMLNLPILTLSNTIQFGRMFAGGWKTSRNALSKLSGRITTAKNGAPQAALRARGNAVFGGITNSLKVGASEATEEMLQGYVSSGAKNVADTRLTVYNDDGYDRGVMSSFGDWLRGIDEGGWEFLSDTKNWQEGFMGAITGLMGIPGRTWHGGIPEAIRESRDKVEAAKTLAQTLNDRVNSPEFRNLWLGYTRHQKYDQELLDAALKDDEYAWHGADDKMLINDVIMFADAGKLNDLYDIVDRFSSMSDQEAEALGVLDLVKNEENENEVNNDPKAHVDRVIEKASDIKEVIQQYKDQYDAIRTIMPIGTSDEHIKEMLFTSMQIKQFEKRYLQMANELFEGLEPLFQRQDELDELAGKKGQLISLRDAVVQTFTADIWTNLDSLIQRYPRTQLFKELEEIAGENEDAKKKIQDMRRLMEDRRAFFDKLVALKNMTPEKFNKKAKSDTSVNDEIDKEAMSSEVESFNTVADVRDAVFSQEYGERRNKYVEGLNKVRGENKTVDDFLKLYSTARDFTDFYLHQNMNISAEGSDALNYLFNEKATMLRGLNSEQDFLDMSDDVLPSLDDYIKSREESKKATGRPLPREVYESAYNEAVNMLREVLDNYVQTRSKHRASQAARPVSNQNNGGIPRQMPSIAARMGMTNPMVRFGQQQPVTPDAANPGSQLPPPGDNGQKAKIAADGKSAVDADGRTWNVGDVVYGYTIDDDGMSDKQEVMEIVGFEEKDGNVFIVAKDSANKTRKPDLNSQTKYLHKDEAKLRGETESLNPVQDASPRDLAAESALASKEMEPVPVSTSDDEDKERDYMRGGVPEIDSFEAKKAREAIANNDLGALAKADLQDMGTKNPAFSESWRAVDAWNGFRNTVKKAKTGSKVKFVIDSTFPYGEQEILVYTEDGDFLNTLPHKGYKGIEALRKAIIDEYEKSDKPDRFEFSKMAQIWYRPKGLVRYNYSPDYAGERSLMDAGYDKERDKDDAIIFYDKSGKAFNARTGKRSAPDDNDQLAGRIYYMVEDGDGHRYKIRLGIEHYKESNWNTDRNPRIVKIRESANKISELFKDLLDFNANGVREREKFILSSTNNDMHKELAVLKKYLDIVDLKFDIVRGSDGSYNLNIKQTTADNTIIAEENIPLSRLSEPDTLARYLADSKRAVNVDFDTFSKELDDLISSGTLTVNSDSLIPKGADFWMTHWEDGDFVLTDKQREIMEKNSKMTPAPEIAPSGRVVAPETAPQPESPKNSTRPKVVAVKTGDETPQPQANPAAKTLENTVKPLVNRLAQEQNVSGQAAWAALNVAAQGPMAVGRLLSDMNMSDDPSVLERSKYVFRLFNSIFSESEKKKVEKAWKAIYKIPMTGYNFVGFFDANTLDVVPNQFFKTDNPTLVYAARRMAEFESVSDFDELLRAASDILGIYDDRFKTQDIGSLSLDFDTFDKATQDAILAYPMIGSKEKYDALDDDQKADVVLKCLGV